MKAFEEGRKFVTQGSYPLFVQDLKTRGSILKRLLTNKCILFEQYVIHQLKSSSGSMFPIDITHLLNQASKESQDYSNIGPPYNLLFEIFEETELFFWESPQESSLNHIKRALIDILETLTPREEKVIQLIYGILDNKTRTHPEVASEFNVSVSKIQRIKEKALGKLRHPSAKKALSNELLLDNECPSIPKDSLRQNIYENFIQELHDTAIQRFHIYDKAFNSIEDVLFHTLSSTYPQTLVTDYLNSEKEMIRWLQRMHNIENQPIEKYLQTTPSIYSGLLHANISTIGELYDTYRTGELWSHLINSPGVGQWRAQQFVDDSSQFFKKHELIVDGLTMYDRDFLKVAIEALEELCISCKTSIRSIFIPANELEILLYLNYRTIEDLVSDYRSEELKRRCESKYSKCFLGNIYSIISEFMADFLNKSATFTRVQLIDFKELPKEFAKSLNAPKKALLSSKIREASSEDTPLVDLDLDLNFDLDFDFDVDFELGINFQETKITDLDVPLWVKQLLQQAGFICISDLLNEHIDYDKLLMRYDIGVIAIEKLYRAMENWNVRLEDCSEIDYPNVEDYLLKKRTAIRGALLSKEGNRFATQRKCSKSAECSYKSNDPLRCNKCKYPELKESIESAGFSIEREYETMFYLRHNCGCGMKYELDNSEQPICNKCKHPKLVELIESANFSIEESYSTGFYIRHVCGYRRRYRFDNTEKPICQGCSQSTNKRWLERLQQEPLELTLLQDIDKHMEQNLMDAGIDNTKKFLSNTPRQIYRRFIERNIHVEPMDILTLEAARKGIPVSNLNQSTKEDLLNFAESYEQRIGEKSKKELEHAESVIGLPNIGPDRGKKLESIGIVYSSDLIESPLSTETIWEKLYSIYPSVDLQDIYAIEGARRKHKMKDLPKERKRELRMFVEHFKGPWGTQESK